MKLLFSDTERQTVNSRSMTSERKERRQMKTTSVPVFCSSGTYWTLALGPTVSMSRGGQCSKFEDVEATEIYGAKYHTGGTSTKRIPEIYIQESCGSQFS